MDDRGHKLGEFNKNGDIWIARCTVCKDAAIIHEDGRISGNTLNYDCTENNGP